MDRCLLALFVCGVLIATPHPVVAQKNHDVAGKTCIGRFQTSRGHYGAVNFKFFDQAGALMVHARTEQGTQAWENYTTAILTDRGQVQVVVNGNNLEFTVNTGTKYTVTYHPSSKTLEGRNSLGADLKSTTCT